MVKSGIRKERRNGEREGKWNRGRKKGMSGYIRLYI